MNKISIRFYKDYKVRAVWDEDHNQWWFSILDIVGAVNEQEDHEKNRNYWKYLKAKLKKENSEVVSATTQLKLTASDGKKYKTDVISQAGVESQGQVLDSLKESPIQKECDALKQVILSNRKKHNVRRSLQMTLLSFHSIDD